MPQKKTVDEYIDASSDPELLQRLREIVLETELDETVKWNFPCYCLNNKNVVGLSSFKTYSGVWFFNGVYLSDPAQVLYNAQEGKTKALRQWRIHSQDELDEDMLRVYLIEAIENQKAGLVYKINRSKKKEKILESNLLSLKLESDPLLKAQFYSLTPYKQKEYIEYLAEAKQEKTKVRRLAKIIPMILDGVGLGDKYRK